MKILLVDLSNTLSIGTHAYKEAQTLDGFKVGGIYYTLSKIRAVSARNSIDAVVAAVDWGVPAWRKEMAPEYKAQRKDKRTKAEEELHKASVEQRKVAWKVLAPCGISVARAQDWEGDDVIAALALRKFREHDIVVLSSDKDFAQLVDERVRVFDTYNDKFREPVPHYCLRRCLDPKASDNLDGVAGCGPKTADKLVDGWIAARQGKEPTDNGEVDDFLAWCKTQTSDKKAQHVFAEQQIVRRNWKITYMPPVAKDCVKELKWRRGKFNVKNAMNACREFNLQPILSDFSTYDPVLSRLKDPRA